MQNQTISQTPLNNLENIAALRKIRLYLCNLKVNRDNYSIISYEITNITNYFTSHDILNCLSDELKNFFNSQIIYKIVEDTTYKTMDDFLRILSNNLGLPNSRQCIIDFSNHL